MRFTQMQDIAGCRIVVPGIGEQNRISALLGTLFDVTVFDRRIKPSHGYRAVHVVVRQSEQPVEVQIRTTLQHAWAELSEKTADEFDSALKYGGGPAPIRHILDGFSSLIADFENKLDTDHTESAEIMNLKREIREAVASMTCAIRE